MKVLVTGATTPLGGALVDALASDPGVDHVLAVGHERDGVPCTSRIDYRELDLRRPRALHDLIWGEARDLGIDSVVHGMQHRAIADRGSGVHAQNVGTTRQLVLACTDHPTIRRVVYRSFAEVYGHRGVTSNLIDEEAPLDFDSGSPQWVRDRVEADLTVCAHFASATSFAVLRCAEILAPGCGSQLWDYLQSRVCLRPLGFDPMVNVASMSDVVAALVAALRGRATGVFNIPGFDTLPLSRAIVGANRADIPVPGPLLAPLYALRRWVAGFEFQYRLNVQRFHVGGVLDGTRARALLGYQPRTPVAWPRPRWDLLFTRLGELREMDERSARD